MKDVPNSRRVNVAKIRERLAAIHEDSNRDKGFTMSFQTSCPGCETEYNLADKLLGKTLRCKNCQKTFQAEAAEPEESEDEVETPKPAAKPAASGANRPRRAEKDADAVTSKRSRRDEDDDRPRGKSRKGTKKKKGSNKGLMIGLIGGGVALLVVVLVFAFSGKKPAEKGNETTQKTSEENTGDSRDGKSGSKDRIEPNGKKGEPKDKIQPANSNVVAAYASRVPVDKSDRTFTERTLVVPGFAAICYKAEKEVDKNCAIYDLRQGKRLGGFMMTSVNVLQTVALSPKGKYLATEEGFKDKDTHRQGIALWSLPDGKPDFSRWEPYPPPPKATTAELISGDYRLAWMAFTDADKLLTVSESGRVSLWSMPDRTPIFDKRPLTAEFENRLRLDLYTKEPQNLALSADRRKLALQQGNGVLLVDTTTGEPIGTLQAPEGVTKQTKMEGMAFSPDGTRLFCSIAGRSGDKAYALMIWNIAQKNLIGSYRLPYPRQYGSITAWAWWGNSHLYGTAGYEGLLVDANTGKPLRQCFPPEASRTGLANGQLDGQLWFNADTYVGGMFLVSYTAPEGFLAKDPEPTDGGFYKRIWLTTNGVEKRGQSAHAKVQVVP